MIDDTAPSFVIEAAHKRWLVWPGAYRVVVLEASGALTVSYFYNLEAANEFANDAASESDGPGGSPFAYIFDRRLRFIGRGRHYASR